MRPAVINVFDPATQQELPVDIPPEVTQELVGIIFRATTSWLGNPQYFLARPRQKWIAGLRQTLIDLDRQYPTETAAAKRVRRLAAAPFAMTHTQIAAHVGCELADVVKVLGPVPNAVAQRPPKRRRRKRAKQKEAARAVE